MGGCLSRCACVRACVCTYYLTRLHVLQSGWGGVRVLLVPFLFCFCFCSVSVPGVELRSVSVAVHFGQMKINYREIRNIFHT